MKFHTTHNGTSGMLLAFALLLAFPSWAASASGTVEGSVIDDSGRPVSGARVSINFALPATAPHFAPPPVITGPSVIMVKADSRGIFSVGSLAAGQYIACAEAPAPGLLDPCHWAASAPTFAVNAGETTAGVNIAMARGAVVPIHVTDPQALLQAVSESIVNFDFRIHVVTSKGLHYNVPVQTSGPGSRDYAATIPFGAAVTLRVMASHHLIVNDQTGNPVSTVGASVALPSGASPATVEYVIAGTK